MIEFNFNVKDDKCEGITNIVHSNAADEKEEEEILFDLENVIGEVFNVEVYGIEAEEEE